MERQPKMLSHLWRELRAYFKTYGDVPCYLAIGDTVTPLTDTAVGSVSREEDANASVSMNIVLLCDQDAYKAAEREDAENAAIEDSTYGEQ